MNCSRCLKKMEPNVRAYSFRSGHTIMKMPEEIIVFEATEDPLLGTICLGCMQQMVLEFILHYEAVAEGK